MLRLVPPSDYRRMPWKNGLGTTIEIAVEPPGASIADFDIRVSMATIAQSGPFSSFPGVDRWIALLDGGPVVLSHDGVGARTLEPLVPYPFSGDVATHGQLEGPVARDFNLMLRRGRATGSLAVIRVAEPVSLPEAMHVVFVVQGRLEARDATGSVAASEGETVRADGALTLTGDGTAMVATVWHARRDA